MDNQLKKKYGLITAIAMVIGIVVGSGVFFKAEKILVATGGNLSLAILAWIIGGLIMVVCAYVFAVMATKYEHVNGIIDYAEATLGRGYGYYVGWFLTFIYYPSMTSVLAWVSARYLCVLIGFDIVGAECLAISAFFLIANYALNALSPKLAGKFQVSTTIIKLIPLLLMAVAGLIVGLSNGMTVENFNTVVDASIGKGGALLAAVVATAFAYEGWIIATSINAELKDAKKNLPIALVLGTIAIVVIYILYYVGLAGGITNAELMQGGEAGAKMVFSAIFGKVGGTALFVFVVISCLGTLNGLMLGCTRGMYSIAVRNEGPRPDVFRQIDPITNMPTNSAIIGLLLCGMWLLYFFGANLTESWFGPVCFDSSELPIITIYAFYIPIFLMFMIREKEQHAVKRFVMPILGICGCLFMVYAAIAAHGQAVLWYLFVFAVIMLVGMLLRGKNRKA